MKKIFKLFGLLSLLIIILVGCAASEENNAEKAAKAFGKEFYTVDSGKIKAYIASIASSDIHKSAAIIESNDKSIKSLMTDASYKILVLNRYNTLNAEACSLGRFTMDVLDFTLSKSNDDIKGGKVAYNFKAKIKFTSSKDDSVQTDIIKGDISLKKENDEWKVSGCEATSYPKIMKDALKLK